MKDVLHAAKLIAAVLAFFALAYAAYAIHYSVVVPTGWLNSTAKKGPMWLTERAAAVRRWASV